MEKITKTYVEKIYRGLLFSESSIKEVAERNPMQVENDGKMQGFRFYDKEYVVDGEKTYDGEKSNYSKWIYFGKRYSLDEIKAKYGNNPDYRILISNMEGNGYNYVCHTQAGSFLPMEEGDMTFAEYFAKQGEEYRRYWNKQYGIDDSEEKGTVNPAVLTIKKNSYLFKLNRLLNKVNLFFKTIIPL